MTTEPMSKTDPALLEIKNERIRQGLSQAKLAKRSGYSERAIRSMELGQYSPRFHMVSVLTQALGGKVHFDWEPEQ